MVAGTTFKFQEKAAQPPSKHALITMAQMVTNRAEESMSVLPQEGTRVAVSKSFLGFSLFGTIFRHCQILLLKVLSFVVTFPTSGSVALPSTSGLLTRVGGT